MLILFSAFLMGIFAVIIPGPIVLSGVASILSHDKNGLQVAIRLVCISVLVEFFIAFGLVRFGSVLPFGDWFFAGLALVGSAVLFWLSFRLWSAQNSVVDAQKINFSDWQMVAITAFNPMLWTMWSTVSVPLALQVEQQLVWGGFWYVIVFLSAILFGHIAIFVLVHIIKEKFLSPAFTKRIFQVVSAGFVFFAVMLLWNVVVGKF